MIVRFSVEAENDFEGIGDYIAQDNPARAVSFIRELRTSCLSLAQFPNRFPLVRHFGGHGVRQRRHGDYAIFYRVETDSVAIIHILHGAQDHENILLSS